MEPLQLLAQPLLVLSPHRHVRASLCISAPLPAQCVATSAMLVGLVVALLLMALWHVGHAGRERARLSASACAWASMIMLTVFCQGEDEPSSPPCPVSLFLSFSL